MPNVGVVQSTNFVELLRQLGITRADIPFMLQSEIVPVALVTSGVAFTASPTPPYRVTDISTAGTIVAPAANTNLADTGPLPIGSYSMKFVIFTEEANRFEINWRNAADSAVLQAVQVRVDDSFATIFWESRFQIENAGERFRVTNVTAGGVGIPYRASILARI